MFASTRASLLALAVLSPLAAQTATPFLFGLEGFGPGRLVRMHQTTGQRYQTLNVSSAYSYSLATDGRTLLATEFGTSQLVRIDPFTGTKTVIGSLPSFNSRGLAVDPRNGNAYLASDGNGRSNTLYRINKTTAALTTIGAISLPPGIQVFSLGISPTGVAYITSGGFSQPLTLWRINLANAQITQIGAVTGLPSPSRIDDLAFASNGRLYALQRPTGGVYQINPATAAGRFVFDTGNLVGLTFFVSCPRTVASATNYGRGFGGTRGIPTLTASAPRIGTTVVINVSNSLGAPTVGALLVGPNAGNLPTPFGGTLLVSPIAGVINLQIPAGGSQLRLPIPHDPTGCGASVYFQAVEVDNGSRSGLSFTRGLRLILGS